MEIYCAFSSRNTSQIDKVVTGMNSTGYTPAILHTITIQISLRRRIFISPT